MMHLRKFLDIRPFVFTDLTTWDIYHYLLLLVVLTPWIFLVLTQTNSNYGGLRTLPITSYFPGIPSTTTVLQCNALVNTEIKYDKCYNLHHPMDPRLCKCKRNKNSVSYAIPNVNKQKPLTMSQLNSEVIFTFIQNHGSGASEFRRTALFPAIAHHKWDAAGFGTVIGWRGLGQPWTGEDKRLLNIDNERFLKTRVKPNKEAMEGAYIRCGKPVISRLHSGQSLLFPFKQMKGCDMRVVWGPYSLGLCQHFPNSPCVYITIVRNPVDRLISHYDNACALGIERQQWPKEWFKLGRCPVNITEFANLQLETALVERFSRGCDKDCGDEVAIRNLKHPCMRYLLYENITHGADQLGNLVGKNLGTSIRRAKFGFPKQGRNYAKLTTRQLAMPGVHDKLLEILQSDIKFYKDAQKYYSEQWTGDLYSCNPID